MDKYKEDIHNAKKGKCSKFLDNSRLCSINVNSSKQKLSDDLIQITQITTNAQYGQFEFFPPNLHYYFKT